jgi:hypothetical protein
MIKPMYKEPIFDRVKIADREYSIVHSDEQGKPVVRVARIIQRTEHVADIIYQGIFRCKQLIIDTAQPVNADRE